MEPASVRKFLEFHSVKGASVAISRKQPYEENKYVETKPIMHLFFELPQYF